MDRFFKGFLIGLGVVCLIVLLMSVSKGATLSVPLPDGCTPVLAGYTVTCQATAPVPPPVVIPPTHPPGNSCAGWNVRQVNVSFPVSMNNPRLLTRTIGNFGNFDMIVIRFVAVAGQSGRLKMGFDGADVTRLATLATVPCAVATSGTTSATILASSGGSQPVFSVTTPGVGAASAIKLVPGTAYYANFVNRSDYNGVPTCSSSNCPAYIDFNSN